MLSKKILTVFFVCEVELGEIITAMSYSADTGALAVNTSYFDAVETQVTATLPIKRT